MTDLLTILPTFPQAAFAALLPTIEQHRLSTTDLLALHPADIAKQTHLPLLDLKRLVAAVQASLSDDLIPQHPLEHPLERSSRRAVNRGRGVRPGEGDGGRRDSSPEDSSPEEGEEDPPPPPPPPPPSRISTLDGPLDASLAGGIPTSSITEITGESGAGKTQFLLTLCLAVQLPPPHGLSKQALYISTESGLATRRLSQILSSNQTLQGVDASHRPSLDNILSTATPDLESQDHILEYQVPVLLSRHNIGLVVIDSVAANYRAEFERSGSSYGSSYGSNMAARSAALVRTGALLRNLARRHHVAVVVANQVADRFASPAAIPRALPPRGAGSHKGVVVAQESPLASRSMAPTLQSTPSSPSSSSPMPMPLPLPFSFPDDQPPPAHPALRLDHQQRWFTGWGDDARSNRALKTPSLGLVWSTQISCRIALLKRPVYGRPRQMIAPMEADDGVEVGATLRNWRRWMKVVFASHAPASDQGLEGAMEFEVYAGGVRSVQPKKRETFMSRGEGR